MRLRRETGDFNIVLTSANQYKCKANDRLWAEDLVGQVAKVDGVFRLISNTKDVDGGVTMSVGDQNYKYTRETELIEKV